MQQKYTAADVREKRISFKGLTQEQFLALQAHFHKLYPEDGYMDCEWDRADEYHRFYVALGNPKDVCYGRTDSYAVKEKGKSIRSTLEITYDEFEFGQFVVGETYVGELDIDGDKHRVIFKPTSPDNSTECYFINAIDVFSKDTCCHGKAITFRKATDEETEQLRKAIADEIGDAAIEIAYQAADNWIPWNGGECPVPEGTLVDVRHRNGAEYNGVEAVLFGTAADWSNDNVGGDIVAYRVCKADDNFNFAKEAKLHNEKLSREADAQFIAEVDKDVLEKMCCKSILLEAEELINGERAKDYGRVTDNFKNIADGWNIIINNEPVTPRKVGLMMAWLKICRDVQNPKHDNLVDTAGYMGCIDKMSREQ